MDRADMLRVTVGAIIVVALLSMLGGIVYLLYGPGITVTVPDFFMTNKSTSTEGAFTSAFLLGQAGTFFECDNERALKVELLEGRARLALSDGRHLILPQAVSASGTKYANPDESFVFWTRGNAAFVEEHGVTTYASCATP